MSLSELITLVRSATSPDRELDWTIEAWLYRSGRNFYGDMEEIPKFTASIDHAFELTARLLGDDWFTVLLDAARDFGAAGTLPPTDFARFVVLHTFVALGERQSQ